METSHLSACGIRYILTATSLTHAVRESENMARCTSASSSKGHVNTLYKHGSNMFMLALKGAALRDVYGLSNVTLLQRCND